VNVSLNEVEALARKAIRGVGYSWGLAEEAGKSARWLCQYDFDGCATLARFLALADDGQLCEGQLSIELQGVQIRADNGSLVCPIVTGSALLDLAHLNQQSNAELHFVAEPELLLFFVSSIARINNVTLSMSWPCGEASFSAEHIGIVGELPAKLELLRLQTGRKCGEPRKICQRAETAAQSWSILDRFAQRTYAPSTEQSRLAGAGAGLSDND